VPPLVDDLGTPLPSGPVARVVSLVPSLSEAVALTAPGLLAGATDWCTSPGDLRVQRVGGTKWPRLDDVVSLAPDLVLANAEENRLSDLEELRGAGLRVWVTGPTDVPGALTSLDRMLRACGLGRPAWLDEAERLWAPPAPAAGRRRAVVPIWRRPWMALGRDTFAGDVLARLGVDNVLADSTDRYPKVDLAALPPHDLVVLPDEPYRFSADDGPEAFPDVPAALVSGRHLTWYGPSLMEARTLLADQLAAARRSVTTRCGNGAPASRGG
jgi:ABC-type Fe3+-hydroxamate transport system substrate-binding protein